jgi:hypothetical protein
MSLRRNRAAPVALAVLTMAGALSASAAKARENVQYAPEVTARYGSVDPCRREAGNRALTWGVIGVLAGGLAGGAAAGAGVVAEGAGLGALVGGVIGAKAGAASAACGTARDPYGYWNHPSYRAYQGQEPSPYYADPYAAEAPGVHGERSYDDRRYDDRDSRYEYRSSYSYDSRYDRDAYDSSAYDPQGYEGRRCSDCGDRYGREDYRYDDRAPPMHDVRPHRDPRDSRR